MLLLTFGELRYWAVCDQIKIILSCRQESELRKCEIFLFAHMCIEMTMRINDSDAVDLAVAGESLPETSVNEGLLSSRRNGKIGEEATGTNFIMLPS